jgi:hypothetical protein
VFIGIAAVVFGVVFQREIGGRASLGRLDSL